MLECTSPKKFLGILEFTFSHPLTFLKIVLTMKRGRSETDIFAVGEPTPAPSPNPPDPFAQAMMAQLAQLQAQLQQYMTHPPTEPATPLSTTPTAAIPTPHSATPTDARVAPRRGRGGANSPSPEQAGATSVPAGREHGVMRRDSCGHGPPRHPPCG